MEFIIFIIVVIVIVSVFNGNKRKKQEAHLLADYQDALQSGDRNRALQAGRSYYGFLRKGKLTIYDEQAITNDLSTMR